MARMVVDRVAATPQREAFRYRVGESWQSMTWAEVGEQVRSLAAGLLSLGVRIEDRVAIVAGTRIEWILADFAILCAGAATTTVYPSTPPDDVAYIVGDAGLPRRVRRGRRPAREAAGAPRRARRPRAGGADRR
jgi:long-chain acyl-CoA synthetase